MGSAAVVDVVAVVVVVGDATTSAGMLRVPSRGSGTPIVGGPRSPVGGPGSPRGSRAPWFVVVGVVGAVQ